MASRPRATEESGAEVGRGNRRNPGSGMGDAAQNARPAWAQIEEAHVAELTDKHGRTIGALDVLKVFHFVGARRKRHYMYKQAVEYTKSNSGAVYLKISHLNKADDDDWRIGDNYYLELADGRQLAGYEIVSR